MSAYPPTSTDKYTIKKNKCVDCPRECDKESHYVRENMPVISDQKFSGVFIRKVIKSGISKLGKKKKSDRVYQNYHCCLVCRKLASNITKHLCHHKDDKDVNELLVMQKDALDEEDGERKSLQEKKYRNFQAMLRNKGEHQHNVEVLNKGIGELLISRCPDKLESVLYGPCPLCYEWIKVESSASKHQDTCPALGSDTKLTKGESIICSAVLVGCVKAEASTLLIKEVFPIMTRDNQTELAISDPLIIGLCNSWLRRNIGNKLKRKYYTSSKMRGAVGLLIHLRQISGENLPMELFLKPQRVDEVADAALKSASQSFDDEKDLAHPCAAIRIGFDVGRLVNIKLCLALRKEDSEKKKEALDFLSLMKIEWTEKVSKLAHNTLNERKMLKGVHLPVPSDLAKLSTYIKTELGKLDLSVFI